MGVLTESAANNTKKVNAMAHILLVDDEQNILNALRRELGVGHDVETFTSPREALQRAKATEFDLVVTDYRMPDMDGVSFLERFAQNQPDAMRLILSGQADMDALLKAITISHAYRFLSKPWDKFDLEAIITQALSYREAMLENRRLAEAFRQQYGATPAAQARITYRILLATSEANDAALMMRELTFLASREMRHGAIPYVGADCSSYGGEDFQAVVDCFTTQQEALEQLEKQVYDLLIIDLLMLDGGKLGFLDEIRKLSPESACILVGTAVDMDTLVSAINQTQVDDFIKRPWNAYELKAVVLRALRYRDLRLENRRLADLFHQQENMTGHLD